MGRISIGSSWGVGVLFTLHHAHEVAARPSDPYVTAAEVCCVGCAVCYVLCAVWCVLCGVCCVVCAVCCVVAVNIRRLVGKDVCIAAHGAPVAVTVLYAEQLDVQSGASWNLRTPEALC
jgi:hypothetical protein